MEKSLTDIKLDEIAEEWINRSLHNSAEVDVAAAQKGFDLLYRIADMAPPELVICADPVDLVVQAEKRGARLSPGETFDRIGAAYDAGWTAFFEAFQRAGIDFSDLLFDEWLGFLKSGVWATLLYDTHAFVCAGPSEIHLDTDNNMHADGKKAISWPSGEGFFFLHGVAVSEEIAMTPANELDPLLVLREKNVDVRREMIRKIGNVRLLGIGVNVLEEADEYQLITFDIGDGRTRPFLKMTCTGTGLTHVLGVRPGDTTLKKALAFVFSQEAWRRPLKEDHVENGGTFEDFEIGQTVYRHGDVHLKKTGTPVEHRTPSHQGVLHHGVNHDHTISGDYYIREEGGRKFLGILSTASVSHSEHGVQTWSSSGLRRNTELEVAVAREYDHWLEESREVLD